MSDWRNPERSGSTTGRPAAEQAGTPGTENAGGAAADTGGALERTTEYALEQRRRLRKVLRPRDLILFATSGIIGIDTIAQSSVNGVQTIFWVVFSCVFFAIPYALIAAEMGSTYVKNGGLYVWIKEAYHPYLASLLTFMYWISNPIWMASLAVEAVSVMERLSGRQWSTGVEWLVALLLIWLVALLEITYLNVGKWLPNIGAVIKVLLLVSVGAIALGIVIHTGHAANSFAPANFLPTKAVAVSYLPVLMYQWQGFELQSNAAQEMVNPKRDVPVAILWSALLSAAAYILGVLGLLLVIPLHQMSNVSGLFDAYQAMLPRASVTWVFAVLIIVGLLSSGTTWLLGVDRAFAASGYDGNVPRFLGHFNPKFGTPDIVAIIGACVSTLFLTLQLFSQGTLGAAYQILLYMAVLAGTAPYLFMFPALLIFRRRYPDISRPFAIPGGQVGAWLCVVIGLAWIVPTFIFAFLPHGLQTKPSTAGEIGIGVLIALVVSTILYALAAPQRRNQVHVSLVDETDAKS